MSTVPSTQKLTWQLPFDLYDFFGYLFPGVMFICALIILFPPEVLESALTSDWLTHPLLAKEAPWWVGVLVLFGATAFLYSIGHVISSFGAVILDRLLFRGIIGHPAYEIFQLNTPIPASVRVCYEFLFAGASFWLFHAASGGALDRSWVNIIVALCLVPVLLRILDTWVTTIKKAPGFELPSIPPSGIYERLMHPHIMLARVVLDPLAKLFLRAARMDEKIPDSMILAIKKKLVSLRPQLDLSSAGQDAFWIAYNYVAQNSEVHRRAIHNFLHLFSFSRNLAAALMIPVVIAIADSVTNKLLFTQFNHPVAVGLILGAWIAMWRYYYLFAKYYTEYTLRAFLTTEAITDRPSLEETGNAETATMRF